MRSHWHSCSLLHWHGKGSPKQEVIIIPQETVYVHYYDMTPQVVNTCISFFTKQFHDFQLVEFGRVMDRSEPVLVVTMITILLLFSAIVFDPLLDSTKVSVSNSLPCMGHDGYISYNGHIIICSLCNLTRVSP